MINGFGYISTKSKEYEEIQKMRKSKSKSETKRMRGLDAQEHAITQNAKVAKAFFFRVSSCLIDSVEHVQAVDKARLDDSKLRHR